MASRGRGRRREGVALMLALWLLVVLGAVSLQVLAAVRTRVDLASLSRSETVARYAAESGVVVAQTLLDRMVQGASTPEEQARVYREFRRRVEGWEIGALGMGRYQVAVEDLNSRVDLNNARDEVLEGLLVQFTSPGEARSLVEALRVQGRASDRGSEEEAAEPASRDGPLALQGQEGSPQPILHLDQLTLIPEFSDALVTAIAPYVTTLGDGMVNVATAPLPVLTAVPDVGPVAARVLVDSQDQEEVLGSRVSLYSRLAGASAGPVSSRMPDLGTVPRRVLVVSRGWADGSPYVHEVQAVVEVNWSQLMAGARTRVRFWEERAR